MSEKKKFHLNDKENIPLYKKANKINYNKYQNDFIMHYFYPLNIHSFEKDGLTIFCFIYHFINATETQINAFYVIKGDDNKFYSKEFQIEEELENLNNFSDTFIISLFDKYKDELLSLTLTKSIDNFYSHIHNEKLFHMSLDLKEKEVKNLFVKKYPFLNKYKKDNNENLLKKPDYPFFITHVLDEVFFPYNGLIDSISDKRKYNCFTEEELNILLKEKNPLKQIKSLIPLANKHTLHNFKKIFNYENNTIYEEKRYGDVNIYISLLNKFKNINNLNKFINEIETIDYSSILTIGSNCESYNYKNVKKMNNFIENDLDSFFTSQTKMENYLIKFLKNASNNLIKDIEDSINNVEEMIEEDEDFYDDEYFELNLEILNSLLNDLITMIQRSKKLIEKLKEENNIENEVKIKLMEKILHTKYNDLKKYHDELSDVYNLITTKYYDFESINLKNVIDKENNLILDEVLNSVELKKIGNEMNHCVGSYVHNILDGHTSIFFVKNIHSNEYMACLEYDTKNKSIVQAKAKYNHRIRDKNTLNLIENFIIMNKLTIDIDTNELPFERVY